MLLARIVTRLRRLADDDGVDRRWRDPAHPFRSWPNRSRSKAVPDLGRGSCMGAHGEPNRADSCAEQIEAAAQARLRESRDLGEHPIECHFHGGTLTLRGRVPTHFLKQTARSLALGVEGVKAVDNRIDVVPFPVDDPYADTSDDHKHEFD
jgi:hypothetical protein